LNYLKKVEVLLVCRKIRPFPGFLSHFLGYRGVWGGVGVGIDLVLADSLRVLGRFGPGVSLGLSLGLVSDLAIRFL
jgi:hypothetical protein